MIPYGHQFIDDSDIKTVTAVLRSDWLTQGPQVRRFEQALAKFCGVKYAVAVSSGTAALHLAYLAVGLRAGDEAITTPNTFAATANMLLAVGVRPVFGDIRADTYNLDESKIEKLITKKTKAIIPVHFAGQPCAMIYIKNIAKKHNLRVIEDACHALGARYRNTAIGSCKHSDLAVFSFHPVKSITTGEGGAIATNSKTYYEKLLLLRSHGMHKGKDGKNVMIALGYNYRITDIQSALGVSQLKKLASFIKRRHQVA
ncbi:MAG: DegT/DnrJ/EryC1/StrS family aminotransferase, partial [Patescibacteria group bacterium]